MAAMTSLESVDGVNLVTDRLFCPLWLFSFPMLYRQRTLMWLRKGIVVAIVTGTLQYVLYEFHRSIFCVVYWRFSMSCPASIFIVLFVVPDAEDGPCSSYAFFDKETTNSLLCYRHPEISALLLQPSIVLDPIATAIWQDGDQNSCTEKERSGEKGARGSEAERTIVNSRYTGSRGGFKPES